VLVFFSKGEFDHIQTNASYANNQFSYVLFSIGNVKPLLASAFPSCWKSHTVCNETWIDSIEYLEIVGIIVGQILVGVIGDWMGRRFGLIQDATIMFIGLLMLTAAWGVTLSTFIIH
jgi:MFS family permease